MQDFAYDTKTLFGLLSCRPAVRDGKQVGNVDSWHTRSHELCQIPQTQHDHTFISRGGLRPRSLASSSSSTSTKDFTLANPWSATRAHKVQRNCRHGIQAKSDSGMPCPYNSSMRCPYNLSNTLSSLVCVCMDARKTPSQSMRDKLPRFPWHALIRGDHDGASNPQRS